MSLYLLANELMTPIDKAGQDLSLQQWIELLEHIGTDICLRLETAKKEQVESGLIVIQGGK